MHAITLNQTQKLFVVNTGSGYSCLGFQVVYDYACELVERIAKASRGQLSSVLADNDERFDENGQVRKSEVGTLAQYGLYQRLLDTYAKLNDSETWFDARTPPKVRSVLERYRKSGATLRVFYGDTETGRDWMDEYDTIGHVGRSTGTMKAPLLVPENEHGGPALLTSCIVRMMDVATGKEVYRHPKYHLPAMELRALKDETGLVGAGETPVRLSTMGYTHGVWVQEKDGTFVNHANFKSLGKAAHWMAFLAGESMDLKND